MNFVNNQSQGPSDCNSYSLSQNVQRLWVWFTCCKKHPTDCVQLNESHYEVLKTRHYLCCQTHLLQLFLMSGWGFIILKRRDRDFFYRARKLWGCFSLFLKNQRQPDMYLLLKCKNLKQQGIPISCAVLLFWYWGREETWAGEVGSTSIWVV